MLTSTRVVLGLAVGVSAAAGCAHGEGKAMEPVVLPTSCRGGPHCVTGQVSDQHDKPIKGVVGSIIGPRGEGYQITTAENGFFFLDQLPAPPREMKFSKPGYESRTSPTPARPPMTAVHLYVQMRRLGEGECSCDPNAVLAGREACPEEKCR